MSDQRSSSLAAHLARRGFADPADAARLLAEMSLPDPEAFADALTSAADPDQALRALHRLDGAGADIAAIAQDEEWFAAVAATVGMSTALADHLVRHPRSLALLREVSVRAPARAERRETLLLAVGADPRAAEPTASASSAADALRIAYRDELLTTVARDLVHSARIDDIAEELADLADAALEAGLAIARAELPADAAPCRLAVIAMGKCGGRELNYVSDVDVIFVAEPVDGGDEEAALRTGQRLAAGVMRVCGEATAEGSLWQVDAALRPEGKQGALVRTLASHVGYYERWAKTWEFQALLKARPAAGDRALGEAYVDAVSPFVWTAADGSDFVADVQRMRQRVEDHIPAREADRQLKLGRGGLRDVEFSVQLLQLVHGRSDVMLRSPATLIALEALSTWGYVGREDGATLGAAYRFLRTLEHRIQLHELRRSHIVPDDDASLRRIGRSLGMRADPVAELTAEWRRHAREVRRIHEKLFYRPLLQAVARLDPGDARLSPEAAGERLAALGYADPSGALRHLEALTSGVSRRAAIQRTLLPVLLGWFADGPDPDAALLGFRRMSDDLGSTPWYLRLLRDESLAAERMATILSSSRFATDLLLRSPDAVALLAEDRELMPRSLEALVVEARAAVARHDDAESAVSALRALRRRELFRIAACDVLGLIDDRAVMTGLSDVTEATLIGALEVAERNVAVSRPDGRLPTRVALIAMGRFGGRELGYSSDADLMFVHQPLPDADEQEASDAAFAVANDLRRLLMAPSPDPPLEIDADLRPEGRQGPLVRSLESYRAYYERWSAAWEAQALLRARPCAGDAEVCEGFMEMIDPLRWPAAGIGDADTREMRRLKARMESERLPRGADPSMHLKQGRGGLADVEWVAQLLQLRHAAQTPGLRTTSTLAALDGAVAAGLLDEADADTLRASWLLATRVRNAITLATGRASDSVPTSGPSLATVAHLLGNRQPADLLEDYRRATRRARGVVERVFYE
ncbi:MAG: bifunctional [glutamine synthetase] adenylyltransferase/[glutamine synthetase]-adenylyl-L-tyrosine phosphorylase [Actinobacteria bacterium]|nr:bifunctional [glutamine synthetase] adenylyltransferase/[glutamine synthetase]-adenylyl-L-tyrosine phosphorylase [Actinomycetota bacterium]